MASDQEMSWQIKVPDCCQEEKKRLWKNNLMKKTLKEIHLTVSQSSLTKIQPTNHSSGPYACTHTNTTHTDPNIH